MDRMDAEGPRGGDVRCDIVDIDGALRLDRKPLDQQHEDARGSGLINPTSPETRIPRNQRRNAK